MVRRILTTENRRARFYSHPSLMCDEVTAGARTMRRRWVRHGSQVFGLRTPHRAITRPVHRSPRLHPRLEPEIGFAPALGGMGNVMRYRSATVAESHGLPCVCQMDKERTQDVATKLPVHRARKRKACARLVFHAPVGPCSSSSGGAASTQPPVQTPVRRLVIKLPWTGRLPHARVAILISTNLDA